MMMMLRWRITIIVYSDGDGNANGANRSRKRLKRGEKEDGGEEDWEKYMVCPWLEGPCTWLEEGGEEGGEERKEGQDVESEGGEEEEEVGLVCVRLSGLPGYREWARSMNLL